MLTSNLFAAAEGKTGTPEKATACAAPRKWGSWSGQGGGEQGDGRDGTAVCAAVCRPSCRWAKARRQKIGKGGREKSRKRGQGAEERRQLKRRLVEAEERIEELVRRAAVQRELWGLEEEQEEQEQENERSRIGHGQVVGHACGVDGDLASGPHHGASDP